jgi:hypothetical protein
MFARADHRFISANFCSRAAPRSGNQRTGYDKILFERLTPWTLRTGVMFPINNHSALCSRQLAVDGGPMSCVSKKNGATGKTR